MRNLKKFLALALAMVMAFSLMVTANAATTGTQYSDVAGVTPAFEEAVDVLTGMKVFQGDAEAPTFRPGSSITRAEVAAIIYRLVTGDVTDSQAGLYTTQHPFTDVAPNAWYAGYVGYLHNAKIIKGTTTTTFNPRENVTGYEALAMILRAVGYDKNDEFTGPTWRIEVNSTSKTLGILKDVDTTIYGGTLHLAARRDVVASLLFNTAAYVPMVQYTLAFGYQNTGMEGGVVGSKLNPTLGYKIFGLTHNTGVVVGNEVTGEDKGTTKIGFSLNSARTAADLSGIWNPDDPTNPGTIVDGILSTQQTAFVTTIDDTMTIRKAPTDVFDHNEDGTADAPYYGSAYVYTSDTTNPLPLNVTRTFKISTDLRMFNHAVKVWYDDRSSQYETVGTGVNGTAQFTTNLTTYAYFDKVVNTAVVSVNSETAAQHELGSVGTTTALGAQATNSWSANASNNWKAPGFKLRTLDIDGDGTLDNVAYNNYSFGPIKPNEYTNAITQSPVLKNNKNEGTHDHTDANLGNDNWGLYLLISNSADKALDVVIPLDMTFTKITQINNTTAPYTVGVYNGNISPIADSQANIYFDTWDTVKSSNNEQYAVMAQQNLRNSPNTALNTKVAAIQITGTAPGYLDRPTAVSNTPFTGTVVGGGKPVLDIGPDWNDGNAPLPGGFNPGAVDAVSTYYYQLSENTIHQTYKVLYIDPKNQDLTVQKADGTTAVLHQSVFAEAVDATFTTQMEGVAIQANGTYRKQLEEGRDYTFTLDEQGNYIYWTTPVDTGRFVYGTYIDFTSKVASSTFDYPFVYVGANGEVKQQTNVTKITANNGTTTSQMTLGATVYDYLELPKRDANDVNTAGYQRGYYIGYALNGTELKAIGPYDSTDPDTYKNDSLYTGFYRATENDFGAAKYTVTTTDDHDGILINKTAEDLGAVAVPGGTAGIEYFLTNNTTFYVVDGAGTDNQTVTEYKGLSGLRACYSNVVINVSDGPADATNNTKLWTDGKYLKAADGTDANSIFANKTHPYDMVYYSFGRQDYAQDYMGSAWEIKTVFLPKDALTFTGNVENALRFVGDKTLDAISVVEGDQITRFTMYDKDGNEGKYWVDGYIADGNSSAWVIDQNNDNVFYNLVATGKATVDGQPIYSVRPLTGDDTKGIIGQYNTTTYDPDTKVYGNGTATKDVSIGATYTGATAPALYAATTANSQIAYIDEKPLSATSDLYNVGAAKVVNLNRGVFPGITDLASLNNAGSLTDNGGVPVSCVRSGITVSTIFVNANTAAETTP